MMLSLPDCLCPPTARIPPTIDKLLSYVLPPIVCYLTTAFLVLQPRTQPIRIALWPITAILAFRAATSLDLNDLNIPFAGNMFCIAARTLEWAVQTKPLIRYYPDNRPVDQRSSTDVQKRKVVVLDALDLACNFRGCGWDWSRGLYVLSETRPTSSRFAFAASSLISGLVHAFAYIMLHSVVGAFSPHTINSLGGVTIFDDSLPPHLRYLRSSIVTTLFALSMYSMIRAVSELSAVPGILIFRQLPDQWPPLTDAPWRATSLREFWGRRWHQSLRRILIFLGARPFSLIFGRAGGVVGAFLVSGLYHHLILLTANPSSEMWRLMLPFGMMGVGMLLERAVGGKDVGGWKGWMWTLCWLLLWGNVMVDGWARAGVLGEPRVAAAAAADDDSTSVRQLVAWRLVRMLDNYLHARA